MVTCPSCKEVYHQNATHCPACGTEAPKSTYVSMEVVTVRPAPYGGTTAPTGLALPYASFGERVLAYLIDCLVIIVCSAIAGGIFGDFATIMMFILGICFYAYFDSSKYMGTPGKIIMKLKVVSVDGQRISVLNAIGRHFARFLSGLIFGIGFLFPLFTAKKQTLHDIIARCVVIKAQ